MLRNPQLPANLVTFTEEILKENFIFCAEYEKILLRYVLYYFKLMKTGKQNVNVENHLLGQKRPKKHFQHMSRDFKKWCSLRVSRIGVAVLLA